MRMNGMEGDGRWGSMVDHTARHFFGSPIMKTTPVISQSAGAKIGRPDISEKYGLSKS